MATYVPNATQTTEPTASRTVESAALEFRTLKSSVNTRVDALQAELDGTQIDLDATDVRVSALEQLAFNGSTPGTVVVERQTGDGVDTTFALSVTPVTVATVDVYINGVYQNHNTFTVASNVVTFSEAPLNGAIVEFQVSVPLAIGTTTADAVQYTPAGTGAVATTVQGKLREKSVSVKDFGAVGDGITDDTAAIQAALNTGKTIIVSDGEYLTGALTIATNKQRVTGTGTLKAISTLSDGKLLSILPNVTDVIVEQITIDGNSAARSGGTIANSYELSTNDGCDRTTFRNVKVKNAYGNAIGFYVSNDIKAIGNEIYSFGVNGILILQNCINVEIANNLVDGVGTQNSIFVCGQGVNGSTNVTITGNTCYGAGDYGIEVGNVFTGNHTNVSIVGNTVGNAINTGISFRRVQTGTISANTIYNCGSAIYGADGIFCTGDGGLMYGLSITGNSIKTRSTALNGIHVTNYSEVAINGNTVNGGTTSGIYLEGETGRSVADFSVTGNQISSPGSGISAYSNSAGIFNGTISSNQLNCGANASTIGISLSTNISDIDVTGNQISSSGSQGILVYSTSRASVSNNVLLNCARGNGTDDNRSAILLIGTNITAAGNSVYDTGSTNPMKYALRVHDSTDVQVSNLQASGYVTAATNGYSNTTSYVHTFASTVTSASI